MTAALRNPAMCLMQPVSGPAGPSTGSQRPKKMQQAWPRIEPLEEKPKLAPREGKVELFTCFTSVDIQKNYGKFTMVFDGRSFRKLVHGMPGAIEPRPGELLHFVKDILEAARIDGKIRGYLERNPLRVPEGLRPFIAF